MRRAFLIPAQAIPAQAIPAQAILAQHKLAPRHMYERCYAVLPMIGTGTMADPRRPLDVPSPP